MIQTPPMLSLHHTSHPSGLTRPGRDANPQQVAEYWRRMLIADGAIGQERFSPFSPDLDGVDNDADYFYGRRASRHSSQLPSRPEPAESPTDAPPSTSALRGGRSSPEGDGLSEMTNTRHLHGVAETLRQQIMEAEMELDKCDEDNIELQMALAALAEAQAAKASRAAQEQTKQGEEDKEDDKELKMALAASLAAEEQTGKADLEAALALSAEAASNVEAGVDIPLETPKSLRHDTPAATPASTRNQKNQERRAGAVAGAAANSKSTNARSEQ